MSLINAGQPVVPALAGGGSVVIGNTAPLHVGLIVRRSILVLLRDSVKEIELHMAEFAETLQLLGPELFGFGQELLFRN